MKTLYLFGFVLGLTLASPITRSQECEEDLKKIVVTSNNGDNQRETTHKQIQQYNAETNNIDYKRQSSRNDTKLKKQRVGIIINRIPKTKHESQIENPQSSKHQKNRTSKKKHKTNKVFHSQNAYNTSRKINDNEMFKDTLKKESVKKLIKKRSVDNEGRYHLSDISYGWDTQGDFSEQQNLQEIDDSIGSSKDRVELNSNIMSQNSVLTDSSESSHPIGSSESSDSVVSNESNNINNSNESNYNSGSHESIYTGSDELDKPTVLNEAIDSMDSFEPDLQNSIFTTPSEASDSTNELSDSKMTVDSGPSSESWVPNSSSESTDQDDSSDSSDSSDSNSSSDSTESNSNSDNITESINQNGEW